MTRAGIYKPITPAFTSGDRRSNDRFKKAKNRRTTYLREAASDTIAMAATLLFAYGKPRNEQLLPPNDIARIGSGHERVLRKPSQIEDNS
jgi:hypothetical protein